MMRVISSPSISTKGVVIWIFVMGYLRIAGPRTARLAIMIPQRPPDHMLVNHALTKAPQPAAAESRRQQPTARLRRKLQASRPPDARNNHPRPAVNARFCLAAQTPAR